MGFNREDVVRRLENISEGAWEIEWRHPDLPLAYLRIEGYRAPLYIAIGDAEFIAHAPADLRAALAEMERLDGNLKDVLQNKLKPLQQELQRAYKSTARQRERAEQAEARAAALQASTERLTEALRWYQERAESVRRYLDQKNDDASVAVMTELDLDAGKRAAAALREEA